MLSIFPSSALSDDVKAGRDYFLKECVACHAFACNRDGWAAAPKLGGLFGRKAGGVEDFTNYSDGMKKSEIVWTDETLDAFLAAPATIDSKSPMVENGTITNSLVRKQVIAYLKTEDPSVDLFCPK
jgi:cytochrome c